MKSCLLSGERKPYKIFIAPNVFKETLEAPEFCRILTDELRSPTLCPLSFPMCDGGDGTVAVLAAYLQAMPVSVPAQDALGRMNQITYYICRDTPIIDLAEVCGLKDLRPQEYDVCNATIAGLGKVLFYLAGQNIRHIILGVGGSASISAL